MKLLTASQTRAADQFTITHEPISSLDLMERAVRVLKDKMLALLFINEASFIGIVCGVGNNGGDGMALARLLCEETNMPIEVFLLRFSDKLSEDAQKNLQRLENTHVRVHEILPNSEFPKLPKNALLVDAIFGSGLSRPVEKGLIATAVRWMNASKGRTISIDMPSGLFTEDNSDNPLNYVVKADCTLTFERPKLAMLFDANHSFVGDFYVLPIGLHPDFLGSVDSPFHVLTARKVKSLLRKRSKVSHKGTHGHALIVAGSYGKMGAAVLATKACLRSGVGLTTALIPEVGYAIMQISVPEAMVDTKFPDDFSDYKAIGVGCGLGQDDSAKEVLLHLLQHTTQPLVLDADALNLLAQNPDWWQYIPKNSILTPHPREFERLVGGADSAYQAMEMQRKLAQKHSVYVLFKGAYSRVAFPDGTVWFNHEVGNAGMSTGGTGDVLAGLLTGLLAQGYTAAESVLLGTYLHGMAGDFTAERYGQEAMLASDMINHLGAVFKAFRTTAPRS